MATKSKNNNEKITKNLAQPIIIIAENTSSVTSGEVELFDNENTISGDLTTGETEITSERWKNDTAMTIQQSSAMYSGNPYVEWEIGDSGVTYSLGKKVTIKVGNSTKSGVVAEYTDKNGNIVRGFGNPFLLNPSMYSDNGIDYFSFYGDFSIISGHVNNSTFLGADGSVEEANASTISFYLNGKSVTADVDESGNFEYLFDEDVTSLSGMFSGNTLVTSVKFTNIDFVNCSTMSNAFFGCTALTSVDFGDIVNTSKCIDFMNTFSGCSSLTTISGIDKFTFEKNNSDCRSMFSGCSSLTTLDLSSWDTTKVKYMASMFHSCTALTTLRLDNFVTTQVTNYSLMFQNLTSATNVYYNPTKWNSTIVTTFNNVTWKDVRSYVSGTIDLTTTPTETFEFVINGVLNEETYEVSGETISVDVDSDGNWIWEVPSGKNITSLCGMFFKIDSEWQPIYALTNVAFNNFDTSNVTDMSCMFYGCSGLTSLDLSNWDTSACENMLVMFASCSGLTTLDLNNWDTSACENMYGMFYDCNSLTSLDLSNWDTSACENMYSMFASCNSLTSLDLSNWDTSSVTDMSSMFYSCSALTTLKLDNWTTTQTTSYSYFVPNRSTLTIDYKPSQWNSAIPTAFSSVNWHSIEE